MLRLFVTGHRYVPEASTTRPVTGGGSTSGAAPVARWGGEPTDLRPTATRGMRVLKCLVTRCQLRPGTIKASTKIVSIAHPEAAGVVTAQSCIDAELGTIRRIRYGHTRLQREVVDQGTTIALPAIVRGRCAEPTTSAGTAETSCHAAGNHLAIDVTLVNIITEPTFSDQDVTSAGAAKPYVIPCQTSSAFRHFRAGGRGVETIGHSRIKATAATARVAALLGRAHNSISVRNGVAGQR